MSKHLGIFWTKFTALDIFLDTFLTDFEVWTQFGHIMDIFGELMSKMCPSPYRAGVPMPQYIPRQGETKDERAKNETKESHMSCMMVSE